MNPVIIGNICSFGAVITNSVSGTRKTHKGILGVQTLSCVFYGIGSVFLKGYSSTVQNAVGILRNLAAMRNIKSKWIEWTLIALGVILGIVFNNRELVGWLPVVANLEYSIAVFKLKDRPRLLKYAFILNLLMYSVFSVVIMDYVSLASNLVAIVTTAIFLIKDRPRAEESGKAPPAVTEEDAVLAPEPESEENEDRP